VDHLVLRTADGDDLHVEVARTPRERARGLLGRTVLPPDRALLLPSTRSVHTFGMRFPISVAWLDDRGVVVRVRVLQPGRIAWSAPGGRHVLECSPQARIAEADGLRTIEGRAPWSHESADAPG
jgi:hypothetical protein